MIPQMTVVGELTRSERISQNQVMQWDSATPFHFPVVAQATNLPRSTRTTQYSLIPLCETKAILLVNSHVYPLHGISSHLRIIYTCSPLTHSGFSPT